MDITSRHSAVLQKKVEILKGKGHKQNIKKFK